MPLRASTLSSSWCRCTRSRSSTSPTGAGGITIAGSTRAANSVKAAYVFTYLLLVVYCVPLCVCYACQCYHCIQCTCCSSVAFERPNDNTFTSAYGRITVVLPPWQAGALPCVMRAIVWTIQVASLRVLYSRHTHITHSIPVALRYEFVSPSDKHVQWLWEVLEELHNDDRARFIDFKFCYARWVPKES